MVQIATTDAWEPDQMRNDRGAQLREQVVERECRVRVGQECLDAFQALQETRGQFDPADPFSHASWRPGRYWRRPGVAEVGPWQRRPLAYARPRCRPVRAWRLRSAAGGCARAPACGSNPAGRRR